MLNSYQLKIYLSPGLAIYNKHMALVRTSEQLVTFRVKCRQYIPSKQGKYSFKMWATCGKKSFSVCNMQVYTGKVKISPGKLIIGKV